MVEFFHKLPPMRLLDSREARLLDMVRGKSVLHVGCVDSGLTSARVDSDLLLHAKFAKACSRVVGVDVDVAGLQILTDLGFGDLHVAGDRGLSPVSEEFDLVILGEVLEHVNNPVEFLASYRQNLKPDGKLVITVPNAFCLLTFARLAFRVEAVHEDHVAYYSYSTLRRILERVDMCPLQLDFYSDLARVAPLKRLLKRVYNLFFRIFPQFGEGIVLVAGKNR